MSEVIVSRLLHDNLMFMQGENDPTALGSEQEVSQLQPSLLKLSVFFRRYSPYFGIPVLVLFLVAPAQEAPESLALYIQVGAGLFLGLSGLILRLSTRGYQREQGFILSGPYRYLRNPVEVGALLGMTGMGLILLIPYWYLLVVMFLAFMAMSVGAISYELDLTSKMGALYIRYSKRVSRWIPTWLPGINRVNHDFSLLQAFKFEKDTLLWLVGYGIVYGIRIRYFQS